MCDHTPSFEIQQAIDRACDAFGAAWDAGQSPRIETALEAVDAKIRPRLLEELLRLEIDFRHDQRESPAKEEYAARFPNDAILIARVFDESPDALRPAAAKRRATRHRSAAANLLYGLLALQNSLVRSRSKRPNGAKNSPIPTASRRNLLIRATAGQARVTAGQARVTAGLRPPLAGGGAQSTRTAGGIITSAGIVALRRVRHARPHRFLQPVSPQRAPAKHARAASLGIIRRTFLARNGK